MKRSLASRVGRLNSVQTDGTAGIPVVAYFDETQQTLQYAYFVGMTFDEWVQAIGVNPPGDNVYLPVVVRP